MNPIHRGKVAQGKIKYDLPSKFLVHLSKLEGKRIELVLRQEKSKRSLSQNSYMWGVVYEILSEHTGYTPDEIHAIMKFKFLRIMDERNNEYVRSTTKLNTAEMESYLDKIKKWAAQDLGVFIPDPGEVEAA